MNFLQRMLKTKRAEEPAKKEQTVDTTRTLAKKMKEERIMIVPEVVKNIGLEK